MGPRPVAPAVLLGVLLAAWLWACVQGYVVPGRGKTDALSIGFVLSTMQEERYQKDKAAFEETAQKLGATVQFNSAKNDGQIQIQVVQDILTRGVKVMVIQPVNSDTAKNLVELCKAKNVPVIAYDRIIKHCPLDMYVTQDSYTVGVLQAEAAVKATNGKGRYAILSGTQGHSVAEEITRGVLETLKKYPDVQVVFQQNHPNWAPDEGLASTENLLTRENNDIQAILCNNSGLARGAIQALKKADLAGKVFVAGADADLVNCRYVAQGIQGAEVLKAVKPLAEAAANAAVRMAKGDTARQIAPDAVTHNGLVDVPTINTVVQLVTKENLKSVIIDSGFHPAAEFQGLLP